MGCAASTRTNDTAEAGDGSFASGKNRNILFAAGGSGTDDSVANSGAGNGHTHEVLSSISSDDDDCFTTATEIQLQHDAAVLKRRPSHAEATDAASAAGAHRAGGTATDPSSPGEPSTEEAFLYDDLILEAPRVTKKSSSFFAKSATGPAAASTGGGGASSTAAGGARGPGVVRKPPGGSKPAGGRAAGRNFLFTWSDFCVDEVDVVDNGSTTVDDNSVGSSPSDPAGGASSPTASSGPGGTGALDSSASTGGAHPPSQASNPSSGNPQPPPLAADGRPNSRAVPLKPVGGRPLQMQQQPIGQSVTSSPSGVGNPSFSSASAAAALSASSGSNPPVIHGFHLHTTIGHSARIKCLAIAFGEREYASCSNEDSTVSYQDVRSGRELGLFCGHSETIISAAFSQCGKFLATTSRDNSMMLWDVVTQKALLTFEHSKVVICCAFSRDSKYLVSGCQDKLCRVWETRKGKEVGTFAGHEGIVISVCFSPDATAVCSGAADRTVKVWGALGRTKARHVLQGHQGIVLSCFYTNNGKYIVSNDELSVRLWSAEDGAVVRVVTVQDVLKSVPLQSTAGGSAAKSGDPPATSDAPSASATTKAAGSKKITFTLSCAAPGPLYNYIVVACNGRCVFVLDLSTGCEVLSVATRAPVYAITSGNSTMVAFGDSFGNVYFLSLLTAQRAMTNAEKAALSGSRPKMVMS